MIAFSRRSWSARAPAPRSTSGASPSSDGEVAHVVVVVREPRRSRARCAARRSAQSSVKSTLQIVRVVDAGLGQAGVEVEQADEAGQRRRSSWRRRRIGPRWVRSPASTWWLYCHTASTTSSGASGGSRLNTSMPVALAVDEAVPGAVVDGVAAHAPSSRTTSTAARRRRLRAAAAWASTRRSPRAAGRRWRRCTPCAAVPLRSAELREPVAAHGRPFLTCAAAGSERVDVSSSVQADAEHRLVHCREAGRGSAGGALPARPRGSSGGDRCLTGRGRRLARGGSASGEVVEQRLGVVGRHLLGLECD